MNRKLIRPNLAQIKDRLSTKPAPGSSAAPREGQGNGAVAVSRRRPAPPELTNAEAFYYLKQMNNKTPMILMLDNGEQLRGHIEWYDKTCLKVHREDDSNLLVFKHSIRYLYKAEEETTTPPKSDA